MYVNVKRKEEEEEMPEQPFKVPFVCARNFLFVNMALQGSWRAVFFLRNFHGDVS